MIRRQESMPSRLPILDPRPTEESPPPEPVHPKVARNKGESLVERLGSLVRDGALVAFSGGLDSAFLLWAAQEARRGIGEGTVVALTTTGPSLPGRDRLDALEFSRGLGVEHVWREGEEVHLPDYARNDRDRCYHCKTELFRLAREVAEEKELRWVLYGYNASDRSDDRPGHRAAGEGGVLAPLHDAGLTKPEIRFLMAEAGFTLADKPASPCLSSRIMTGIEITPSRLRDVEEMEDILRRAGASVFRVRVCREEGGALFLRVEAAPEEMEKVLACGRELQEAGTDRGYRWVTLDLGGYRMGGGVL